jgi:hypothetical protein
MTWRWKKNAWQDSADEQQMVRAALKEAMLALKRLPEHAICLLLPIALGVTRVVFPAKGLLEKHTRDEVSLLRGQPGAHGQSATG